MARSRMVATNLEPMMLRVPPVLGEQIRRLARRSGRAVNAQLVRMLQYAAVAQEQAPAREDIFAGYDDDDAEAQQ